MITDKFKRVHNYLRISLTDNCNFRCFYCMPDEDYEFACASKLMQTEEIVEISKIFVSLGVNKIRLTGGEPLVRKDAAEIIMSLSSLPVMLTLTTNASRIHHFVNTLKAAKINSLNISLDTLNADKFIIITRKDEFHLVKTNIELLLATGFTVKVNVVVMKGVNDDEINDFIAWTKDIALHIRFIEFMPFQGNKWTSNKVFTLDEILKVVKLKYAVEILQNAEHDTAKAFKVPGFAGTFGIISTMSEPFCRGCNRMRLTADGKLKNCLFSKEETDILTAFRNGEDIIPLIRESIHNKYEALGGQMNMSYKNLHAEKIQNRSMITIGG